MSEQQQSAVNPAFIDVAHRLADAAGSVIRRHFRTPVPIDDKADDSPVTIADREAERVMRELVRETFPDHGIIGEEHGTERIDAEWVWVFDPIDGTKAFIAGKPTFGTLICLMHRDVPVLGVIDQPIAGERWLGAVGYGATFNGAPIRTRACGDVAAATVSTTDPGLITGDDRAAYDRLEAAAKRHIYGMDCYAYALLSSGFIDLVCEAGLKLYDFAALVPVIQEAGGRVTDWRGQPVGPATDGRVLAAGDAACHAQALKVLGV